MRVKTLIAGAGPTGLGAARRLEELGETDWLLVEKAGDPGGLAGSVLDEKGYTWDLGGHIQFSHYDYFDAAMDDLLAPDEWIHHQRESWVWMRGGFVPYPFQNNLRHLPREAMWECVRGLIALWKNPPAAPPRNFGEWAHQTFGEGIGRLFMRPYNFKVWAWPLEEMAFGWIGDRVAVADLERVVGNILLERDDVSWGPNATFRFPLRGGTGEIWRRCAARLPPERLLFGTTIAEIDTQNKRARITPRPGPPGPFSPSSPFSPSGPSTPPHPPPSDDWIEYDHLLSTIPLDQLIALSDLHSKPGFAEHAGLLRRSATHIIGIGIAGRPPETLRTKCWMYFPEDNCPFYRVTVFSNYSPTNVPDINAGWSLMCEVSESTVKPVDAATIVEEALRGAVATRLVARREDIIHSWHRRLPHGYPTPSLERDRALDFLQPRLMERGVFSRGRFGAWKYEVSNQDHSFMQGVECVDHLLHGAIEMTFHHPEMVNQPRNK